MNIKETKTIIISSLEKMKSEHDKRNVLYDHGVDLINYENYIQTVALDLIVYLIGDKKHKDDVEWWLYESVDKIYYIKDKNKKEVQIDVNSAKNFVDFIMDNEHNAFD